MRRDHMCWEAGRHLHDVGDGEHDGAHIEVADGS